MRTVSLAVLAALTAALAGCDAPQRPRRASGRLSVGDPAPKLTAVKWLNGTGPAAFEPGKVYVLDFWATWCAPCVKGMPHLAELQRKYAADGLVVVPVTAAVEGQTDVDVERFVRTNGPDLALAFAWCTDLTTWRAYFDAAKLEGIPASFVVDKQGNIAFIGHPMELDDVLPKLLGK